MRNIVTKNLATKLFLAGIVCVLSFSSCKKVELGVPLAKPTNSRGKLPPPAVVYNSTLTVTPTGTTTLTTTGTGVYDPNCECYPGGTVVTGTSTVTPTEETDPPTNNAGTEACPSVDYPIYAGAGGNDITKGTNVGTATYSNDGVNLYVTYNYPGPTCPTEIHLWAGSDLATSPLSGRSSPFGQFPYKVSSATCGSNTFTIPLTDLFPAGTTDFCNQNIYIVLHAAMGADANVEGSEGQTAIAYGSQTFGGSRWGWIATYPVCCAQ